MSAGLFDRDGHLSGLGLDRLSLEPETVAPRDLAAARAHLAACADCRAVEAEARNADATFGLTPPRPQSPTVAAPVGPPLGLARQLPDRAPRVRWPASRRLALATGALALAAASLLAVPLRETGAPPDDAADTLRPKGGDGLDFSVWIHDGEAPTLAATADFPVRPGDRMGFVAAHRDAGYLLVLGEDAAGQRYACFPQSDALPVAAVAVAPSPLPTQLPGAMAFDATPGRERIAAVLCRAPFDSDDLPPDPCAEAGRLVVRGARCHVRCATLVKADAPRAGWKEAPPP
jgi:hypothetical protein